MGRKAMHTQEQVFEAADRLAATGQEVTPASLREHLGGGSLTTIYKHHEAWTATRAAQTAPVVIEMPDPVKVAFAQCWNVAASEASKEIATIREKADAEVKTARRRLDEAVAAIAQLEAENETEAARADDLVRQLDEARRASNAAATEAAAKEAALTATAEQLREQLEALKGELRHAHEDAVGLRSERDRLGATLEQVRAEATAQATAQAERERALIQEAANAKAEAARLSDQLKDQKARSVEVIGRLEASKQRIEAELMEARKEAKEATTKLARATGQLETLNSQVAEQAQVIRGFAPPRKGP
ncbi:MULTISPECIES: DNA-binding protein [Burkholderiales]|uniref:DNA-binding protein n=1 Tax=Burkholderiales TaxID=80840 RepID=UPI00301A22B7